MSCFSCVFSSCIDCVTWTTPGGCELVFVLSPGVALTNSCTSTADRKFLGSSLGLKPTPFFHCHKPSSLFNFFSFRFHSETFSVIGPP